ncbi:MAG: 5-oxoprolinase/urea amidolyase family protein [Rhizobiales bacterium]|nr:5-oxoprolinase/urea amidolyase family protein [Hyphomicrobiales bacterium]
MAAGLKVVSPGLSSTIQDLGRRGYQDAGVPVSGPLDRVSFTLANALVGNAANASAIEIRMQGPVLDVIAASVRVALVGGTGGLIVEGEDSSAIAPGRSVRLRCGSRLRCGALGDVACAYLAVEGGIAVPMSLSSASTYARSRIGGLHGDVLQPGDVLPVQFDDVPRRPEFALVQPLAAMLDAPIRVVLGPQDDAFTEDAIKTLLSASYVISSHADRMGFRLQGPKLAHAKGFNIVSDGIVAGSIQVPGSGEPIVLLADAQTTGGYPKIATIISADVPLVGRRRPGASVRFSAVTQEDGEAARGAQEQTIAGWIGGFVNVADQSRIDHSALYSANLVGGVSDGMD